MGNSNTTALGQGKITHLITLGAFFIAILFSAILLSTQVSASPAGWNAGKIIDDYMMTSSTTMNPSQIQAFLNSKVSSCDTYGSQPSEFGGGTRRQWAEARGHMAPYTCLKDYVENGKSSSQIIYDVAQEFTINPQVLIVLLQKEQSLVTDTWPLGRQYRSATGYGCPDTAACDSQYYGFTNQVRWAARMFRAIMNDSPSWYTPYELGENFIRYNPEASCGGSVVNIQNRATQALYNYTPYQPNAGALAAGWGEAYCGAYGNRNFYLYFTNWFNYSEVLRSCVSVSVDQPDITPGVGQTISYTYRLTNNCSSTVPVDKTGVVGRQSSLNGSNADFGWTGGAFTLLSGETKSFTATKKITSEETLYIWPSIFYQGAFIQYNNWGSTLVVHKPNLTQSQALATDSIAQSTYVTQDVKFSTVIKNNEDYAVGYDAIGIPVKLAGHYNYDATWVGPGEIPAGGELAIEGTVNLDTVGEYTYWASVFTDGKYMTVGNTKKLSAKRIAPDFSVSGLSLNTNSPVVGQNIEASFTVKNNLPVAIDVSCVGVVGRYKTFSGANKDVGWQCPASFGPGETKTFTGYSKAITDLGTHYYWIGVLYNGVFHQYNNWGSTVTSIAPNFSVSGLTLNTTSPVVGQNIEVSFSVKNNLSVPVDVSCVGVVGRYKTFSGANKDVGWQCPASFGPGETKTFTGYSRTITDLGTHYYWGGILHNGTFYQFNNWGSTVVSVAS